jgi:RNA polymerase sigma-32 factor
VGILSAVLCRIIPGRKQPAVADNHDQTHTRKQECMNMLITSPEEKKNKIGHGKIMNQSGQDSASLRDKVSRDTGQGNTDGLGAYMRHLSNHPALSALEQTELARKFQDDGDQEAAGRLVSSNLRLVVKIAMKLRRNCMNNNLDLIQEGNVGLMKATRKFDPQKGIKFSYYASFWIKAYILKYIMDNWRMVKIGSSQAQRSLFYNLGKEKLRLERIGVHPDSATISRNLGVPESDVVEMGQILGHHDLSLDTPYNDDWGISPGDMMPASGDGVEELFLKDEVAGILREKINELLPLLDSRERDLIRLRLMTDNPLTLGKIGEKHRITRERVRQIESKLLGKIKKYIQKDMGDFSEDWIGRA